MWRRVIHRVGLISVLMLTCFAAEPNGIFSYMVAPATFENRRNSEGSVLELKDGRLLLIWSDFYSSNSGDFGPARISGMVSSNEGRSFGSKYTLQPNTGTTNVMDVSLLRLRSGKILFFFLRVNSEADSVPMLRVSTDDAKTFSAPKVIPVSPYPSYTIMNNDRALQLKSGRVLLPVQFTSNWRKVPRVVTRVYYSDDEGQTWKGSRTIIDVKEKEGAQESGVVELKDRRVMLWGRTGGGHPYQCYSSDRGETWPAPEPMTVDSPVSPQSIKTIPSTGDLLMVWNNSTKDRFPLTTAISKDFGRTWEHVRNLDDDPAYTYSYTSITFLNGRAIFTYYAGPRAGILGNESSLYSLRLTSVPVDWLYR